MVCFSVEEFFVVVVVIVVRYDLRLNVTFCLVWFGLYRKYKEET